MMPPRPMPDLIVREAGFTLAALEACCDALVGFGHPGQLPQRCPRRGGGEINIDLHHLLVVSIAVASHAEQLLVAWLSPRRPRHHAAFDHLDHQRPLGAVAHVEPLPGALGKRCTPRLDTWPGRPRETAPPAGRRQRRLQGTDPGMARHRQPRALTEAIEPTTPPLRPP